MRIGIVVFWKNDTDYLVNLTRIFIANFFYKLNLFNCIREFEPELAHDNFSG